jgi:hypothetical protein
VHTTERTQVVSAGSLPNPYKERRGLGHPANTQRFTSIIEEYVRKYPEQWLWVHRRWKTLSPGEKGLY